MRRALLIFGAILVILGGLWTLQGLGLVMWPASSFMLADSQWAINGALTVVAGVVLIVLSRRNRR